MHNQNDQPFNAKESLVVHNSKVKYPHQLNGQLPHLHVCNVRYHLIGKNNTNHTSAVLPP